MNKRLPTPRTRNGLDSWTSQLVMLSTIKKAPEANITNPHNKELFFVFSPVFLLIELIILVTFGLLHLGH